MTATVIDFTTRRTVEHVVDPTPRGPKRPKLTPAAVARERRLAERALVLQDACRRLFVACHQDDYKKLPPEQQAIRTAAMDVSEKVTDLIRYGLYRHLVLEIDRGA